MIMFFELYCFVLYSQSVAWSNSYFIVTVCQSSCCSIIEPFISTCRECSNIDKVSWEIETIDSLAPSIWLRTSCVTLNTK